MKIEAAYGKDGFIGYRIAEGDNTVLIFGDQKGMPGIRNGDKFIPAINEEIQYTVCEVRE